MVGGVLLLALEKLNLKIAVIEQKSFIDLKSGKDYRATALSSGNFDFLMKLFDQDARFLGANISNIITEDGILGPKVTFSADNLSVKTFGVNVPNQILKTIVYEKLSHLSNYTFFENVNIREMKENTVFFDSGEELTAKLIIAADGRNSIFRKYVSSRLMNIDYQQTAYVATLQLSKQLNASYERFFKTGPIALLPLPGNRASLIWSLEKEFAEMGKGFDREALKNYIQIHLEGIVEEDFDIVYEAWFPLSAHFFIPPYDKRLLLMGDAAHAMHPVAGQGFNLSVRNTRCLIEIIEEYQRLGLDMGSGTFLSQYWQSTKTNVFGLLASTHFLIRIFGLESKLIEILKKTGMRLVENSSFIKKKAILFASR